VLFDLGNTLVDYHQAPPSDEEKDRLGLIGMQRVLRETGSEIGVEELEQRFYLPLTAIAEQRKSSIAEIPLAPLLASLPGVATGDSALQRNLLLAFHAPTAGNARAKPGAVALLKRAKSMGIRIGLASNSMLPGYCHDLTLENLGLLDHFDWRWYSFDIGVRKPQAEFFRHCLQVARVLPPDVLMVGDSLELDIAPAQALGMKTLWI